MPICRSYFSGPDISGSEREVPRGGHRDRGDQSVGRRAMTRKEAIDELREIQEIGDLKIGHRLADDVLCRLLHSLGYRDVVAEYNKVGKWYDSQ